MNNSELLEIAEEYGTPTFVFDVREFWQRLDKIADIFGEGVRLCFAMKANPFLAAAAADHGERLEVCSPASSPFARTSASPQTRSCTRE